MSLNTILFHNTICTHCHKGLPFAVEFSPTSYNYCWTFAHLWDSVLWGFVMRNCVRISNRPSFLRLHPLLESKSSSGYEPHTVACFPVAFPDSFPYVSTSREPPIPPCIPLLRKQTPQHVCFPSQRDSTAPGIPTDSATGNCSVVTRIAYGLP